MSKRYANRPPEHASQPGPGLVACLTILQPWAHLICTPDEMLPEVLLPQKRVENRTWATTWRGKLVIHAGKGRQFATDEVCNLLPDMVFGAAIGICNLTACIDRIQAVTLPDHLCWLFKHRWAECDKVNWVLEDIKRFDFPVPLRGQQGLFFIQEAMLAQAWRRPKPEADVQQPGRAVEFDDQP